MYYRKIINMTETIRIDLDTVRVYRNKSEWTTESRARSSLGHEMTGNGRLTSSMVALLRRENPHFEGLVEVFRGDTPVFYPTPLKTAFLKGPQPEHLKRKPQ